MSDSAFKFVKVDNFLDDINRNGCFDTADMDGVTPNFQIVLVSNCPQNINDCLDEDGTLIDDEIDFLYGEGDTDGECSLLWSKGVNAERTLSFGNPVVSYSFDKTGYEVKGAFLVSGGVTFETEGSGYVLAYAINEKPIRLSDTNLTLNVDGMLTSIRYGG